MPKTVDVCGTEVSLDLKSDYSEGILSDSVNSKSLLENLVRNNSECTGFLMWFSVFCMTCIFKPTKRSKYVYSLLLFNESQVTNCYHYPSSRYPGPIETLSREIFSLPKLDLHIVHVNDTLSFVISAFSTLHTILLHTTNSAAILMISIIVKNGEELISKVLLRAPRWTWQMFIQKDKTKLIKFLKITPKFANLNAP